MRKWRKKNQSIVFEKQTIQNKSYRKKQEFQIIDLSETNHSKSDVLEFSFTKNQIIMFSLIKVFPPKNEKITINLQTNLIYGPKKQSIEYINELKILQNNFTTKIIRHSQLCIEELQNQLQPSFECKLFRVSNIKLICKKIADNYQIHKEIQTIVQSILKNGQNIFILWFRSKYENQILQLINKMTQNEKKQNQFEQQILQKQNVSMKNSLHSYSSKVLNSNQLDKTKNKLPQKTCSTIKSNENIKLKYKLKSNLGAQKQIQNRQSDKTKQEFSSQKQKPQNYRANTNQKNIYYETQFPINVFNPSHFKNWLAKNKYFRNNLTDIQIQQIIKSKNNQIYRIKFSGQPSKNKLQAIQMYIKNEKTIFLDEINKKSRQQVSSKFQKNSSVIQIKRYIGYKPEHYKESKIRYLIAQGDYKKNNKNRKEFDCLFLKGLITQVNIMESEIRKFLDNVNDDLEDQFKIIFQKLENYLNQKKVAQLIQKVVCNEVKKYKNIFKFQQIKFITKNKKKVLVKVTVNYQKLDNFNNLQKILQQNITKQISIHKLKKINKEVINQFRNKYIFIVDGQELFLIEETDKIGNAIEEIATRLEQVGRKIEKSIYYVKGVIRMNRLEKKLHKLTNQLVKDNKEFKFDQQKQEKNCYKFTLYGSKIVLQKIQKEIKRSKKQLNENIVQDIIELSAEQGKLISSNKKLQQQLLKKYSTRFQLFKQEIQMQIIIKNKEYNHRIRIYQHDNIQVLPYSSLMIFTQFNQIKPIKKLNQFIAMIQDNKKNNTVNWKNNHTSNIFYYLPNQTKFNIFKLALNESSTINQVCFNRSNSHLKSIAFMMPKNDKIKFIETLLENIQKFSQAQLVISLFQTDPLNYINDLKNQDEITQTIWYVQEDGNQFHYSQSGCDKINKAIQNRINQVYLYNQDLNLIKETHLFDLHSRKKITHLKSSKQFPVEVFLDRIEFLLNGKKFLFPQSLSQKVLSNLNKKSQLLISLGVYKIQISSMKQINLFSGYQRRLKRKQRKLKGKNFLKKCQWNSRKVFHQLFLQTQANMKCIILAQNRIKEYLQKNVIIQTVKFCQNISTELMLQAKNYGVSIKSKDTNLINILSYDQSNIDRFKQLIKFMEKNNQDKIEYPSEWQMQTEDIQIFVVNKNTKQFQNVQKAFTCNQIKQLKRIQNKKVYKKYVQQLNFLKQENSGQKPKQLLLFHGTKTTNPQTICLDREESFNINFSSDTNLLGRGIYFAQKSQYSQSYSYVDEYRHKFMMYCKVIVGKSQKAVNQQRNVRDTDYKDVAKKLKYESMMALSHNGIIFAVYKNRRAYPMYLIKF